MVVNNALETPVVGRPHVAILVECPLTVLLEHVHQ